jgi:hypothetical protein
MNAGVWLFVYDRVRCRFERYVLSKILTSVILDSTAELFLVQAFVRAKGDS